MTKIPKARIKEWCGYLRSGEFTQGRLQLQTSSGFCCLGVACKKFIPEIKQDLNKTGKLNGGVPRDQYNAPQWLKAVQLVFDSQVGPGFSLPRLNDDGPTVIYNGGIQDEYVPLSPFTFDEIADCLEAVFIHEVLK